MAYKVKQEQIEIDDLEIELKNGEVKKYTPQFDLDSIMKEYRSFSEDINKLDFSNIDNYDGDYYLDLGSVITKMILSLFGKEQTTQMLEDFEGKYVELLMCILPYLKDVVKPVISKQNKEREDYYKNILK